MQQETMTSPDYLRNVPPGSTVLVALKLGIFSSKMTKARYGDSDTKFLRIGHDREARKARNGKMLVLTYLGHSGDKNVDSFNFKDKDGYACTLSFAHEIGSYKILRAPEKSPQKPL